MGRNGIVEAASVPAWGLAITLLHILRHNLRQVKHRYLPLSSEEYFELGIAIDHAFVCFILKVIFSDIFPNYFYDFRSGQWITADDICQGGTGRQRGVKSGIGGGCLPGGLFGMA
jgi:hypothetical protein